MTKENILKIINKEGLFQYNIFNDHQQKANEVRSRPDVRHQYIEEIHNMATEFEKEKYNNI